MPFPRNLGSQVVTIGSTAADSQTVAVGTPVVAVAVMVNVTATITTSGTLALVSGGASGTAVTPAFPTDTATGVRIFQLGPDGVVMDGLRLDVTASSGGTATWFVYYR